MTCQIDLTDIAIVNSEALEQALLSFAGRALLEALPSPLTEQQTESIAHSFWTCHEKAGRVEFAIFHRMMALIDVLPARTLSSLWIGDKQCMLSAAATIAATMRLNPKWGFNRAKFIATLRHQVKIADFVDAESSQIEPVEAALPVAMARAA